MWMPWYLYIDDEDIKLPFDNIERSDFESFIKKGLIEKVKEYQPDELDEPLEIARSRYRLLRNGIQQIGN
jgi:hypothetical protein